MATENILEQIATATDKMREAQKRYFDYRTKSNLNAAIAEEKKVDELLKEWKEQKQQVEATHEAQQIQLPLMQVPLTFGR